jgi:hypothetical protein
MVGKNNDTKRKSLRLTSRSTLRSVSEKQAAGRVSLSELIFGPEQELPHSGFRLSLATPQGQLSFQQCQWEDRIDSWMWHQWLRIYFLDLREQPSSTAEFR